MMKRYMWVLLLAMASMKCVAGVSEGAKALIAKDYQTALKEFLPLANNGDASAQYFLGNMYRDGDGVPQDDSQAVDLYRKAAAQGDVRAQIALGLMYKLGRGVTKDNSQAADWYRKAAAQSDAFAQYTLGEMYYYGWGVTQDYSQAADWYRKAAAQGDVGALTELGVMYFLGKKGVAKDVVLAHCYFNLAANRGGKKAAEVRDRSAHKLTPAQLNEAKELASKWVIGQPLPTITKTYQSSSTQEK